MKNGYRSGIEVMYKVSDTNYKQIYTEHHAVLL